MIKDVWENQCTIIKPTVPTILSSKAIKNLFCIESEVIMRSLNAYDKSCWCHLPDITRLPTKPRWSHLPHILNLLLSTVYPLQPLYQCCSCNICDHIQCIT